MQVLLALRERGDEDFERPDDLGRMQGRDPGRVAKRRFDPRDRAEAGPEQPGQPGAEPGRVEPAVEDGRDDDVGRQAPQLGRLGDECSGHDSPCRVAKRHICAEHALDHRLGVVLDTAVDVVADRRQRSRELHLGIPGQDRALPPRS
jgi:hypothetical protein